MRHTRTGPLPLLPAPVSHGARAAAAHGGGAKRPAASTSFINTAFADGAGAVLAPFKDPNEKNPRSLFSWRLTLRSDCTHSHTHSAVSDKGDRRIRNTDPPRSRFMAYSVFSFQRQIHNSKKEHADANSKVGQFCFPRRRLLVASLIHTGRRMQERSNYTCKLRQYRCPSLLFHITPGDS